MSAPPYPYAGMPQHFPGAPHMPPPSGVKETEYIQVKTRYTDQNMLNTYRLHLFAEEAILSQIASDVFGLFTQSEVKRNSAEHCLSLEYIQVKTRYTDQNMLATYKFHLFAEEAVLSQLASDVSNLFSQSDVKRNHTEHCLTVTKMKNLTHFGEVQLFRVLSRYGFKLTSSNTSIISFDKYRNDVLSIYTFVR